MIWVEEAKYLQDYSIWIKFNDGSAGTVDLRETIFGDHRPIFLELKDIEKFKRFRVDLDTVVWDNGLDLAPEYLRQKLVA